MSMKNERETFLRPVEDAAAASPMCREPDASLANSALGEAAVAVDWKLLEKFRSIPYNKAKGVLNYCS